MARQFAGSSALAEGQLGLALAPALTPTGPLAEPSFFHGFATHPQVLARGLVTLADVTATRYFQFTPSALRDPVLTGHGDRLRAECFSACNGVYARLDLLHTGFDGGDIGFGTTNVDIGSEMRALLSAVAPNELLHLDVGLEGLAAATVERSARQRPVQMPDRWVRSLGNAAELHHGVTEAFRLTTDQARSFIAALPQATGKAQAGWLTAAPGGARLVARRTGGAVRIVGLHRLSALKRMLTHVTGLTVYGPSDGQPGPVVVTAELPGARMTLGLTEVAWRGHSGEGALLASLVEPVVAEDADLVLMMLSFEAVIDTEALARSTGLEPARVRGALALLAAYGRVGWDTHEQAWFHRELPADPDRVEKDNPRLVGARTLVEAGAVAVEAGSSTRWVVRSAGIEYAVRLAPASLAAGTPTAEAACTCRWYLTHPKGRGACKHVLAVEIFLQGRR